MTWQGARKGAQNTPIRGRDSPNENTAITPGKLADESKLGGLNQLMTSPFSIAKTYLTVPYKKRFSWTSDGNPAILSSESSSSRESCNSYKTENNNIPEKEPRIVTEKSQKTKDHIVFDKTERACKGKKYQEFMSNGGRSEGARKQIMKKKNTPPRKLTKMQMLKKNMRENFPHLKNLGTNTHAEGATEGTAHHNLNLLADLADNASKYDKKS